MAINPIFSSVSRVILTALLLGLALLPLQANPSPGPGLGNLTYESSELFTNTTTPLVTLDTSFGIPQGTGMVAMLRGYLLVPFAADGAGNGTSGGFALIDLSNPRSPSTVFTTHNNSPYRTSGEPNFAGGIGEPHGFTISGNIVCLPINKPGGIEFWDFSDMGDGTPSDPPNPQNPDFASDLTAAYTWSTDLTNFHSDGATIEGTTVSFSAESDTPAQGITTVTATASGTLPDRLFVRIEVSEKN